jgi:hypothetical protein
MIDSLAYVPLPQMSSRKSDTLLADTSQASSTVSYLGRGVRATLHNTALFSKGMVARDTINLNGNNITSDSFDSGNPLYSTNGQYVSTKHKANGDIAVNASLINSLNVGNADIYGHLSTGPGGTAEIGPNGVVGDELWHQGNNKGIEDGYLRSDMNVSFPDVQPPWNGGALSPAGTGGWITNWTYTYTTNGSSTTTISYPGGTDTITTNYPVTSTTYPSGSPGPVTSSVVTNTTATSTLASLGYPAAGTYLGAVSSNYVSSGTVSLRGWYYNYAKITSYTTNWVYPTFTVTSGTISTNASHTETQYDYILDDGNYEQASLSGTVYVRGNAKLYVTSSLSLSDVAIASGKRLDLYCAASDVSLGGNNSANSSGLAGSFRFWGLPSCTSISFSGNSSFVGTIYAPNADFRLNGSGNTPIDFIGASITKTSTMNGHFNFHYDEALAREGGGSFVVTGWNEMEPKDVPAAAGVLSVNH